MDPLSDYEEQTLHFSKISATFINAANRVVCYNQTIYDDSYLEVSEYIGLGLGIRNSTTIAIVDPMYGSAAIEILDDDDDCKLITKISHTVSCST